MSKVFLKLSYKGTKFFGWQIQPNQPSVQEAIEKALTKINSGKEVKIVGCGRTDTGVHASEYYAHVELPFEMEIGQLKHKLNTMLSSDIVIQDIIAVRDEAHSRFDATQRTYHYFIHKEKDPFVDEISWFRKQDLDLASMNKACLMLMGHSNFECFSKVKTEVNNFNCDISKAVWIKSDKGYIFSISANRFLRNMVRAIVGTMIQLGEGQISIEQFQDILDSNNRSEAGQSVPAKGLFLAKIDYPDDIFR